MQIENHDFWWIDTLWWKKFQHHFYLKKIFFSFELNNNIFASRLRWGFGCESIFPIFSCNFFGGLDFGGFGCGVKTSSTSLHQMVLLVENKILRLLDFLLRAMRDVLSQAKGVIKPLVEEFSCQFSRFSCLCANMRGTVSPLDSANDWRIWISPFLLWI